MGRDLRIERQGKPFFQSRDMILVPEAAVTLIIGAMKPPGPTVGKRPDRVPSGHSRTIQARDGYVPVGVVELK